MSLKALHHLWRSYIPSNNVIYKSRYLFTSVLRPVSYIYNITFETGDKLGAGTDSNVFVRLVGDYGSTEELKLATRKKDMERGMTNTYRLATDYVGPLQKLIVRHDSKGIGAAWYLEKITVRDAKGTHYDFPCDSWLSRSSSHDAVKLLRPLQTEKDTPPTSSEPSHPLEKLSQVKPRMLNTRDSQETNKTTAEDETKKISSSSTSNHQQPSTPQNYKSRNDKDASTNVITETQSKRHATSLSPAVRFLRDTYAIDLDKILGSGPQSRVLKGDVLGYMKNKNITEPVKVEFEKTQDSPQIISQPAVETEVDMSRVSKLHTPHLYMSSSCYLDQFEHYSKQLLRNDDDNSNIIQTAFLTRLFTRTLDTTLLDKKENIEIEVVNNGKRIHINDDVNLDFESLLWKLQDGVPSDSTASYVLDIRLAGDGIAQLSSVLSPHHNLVLNISGERKDLTIDGKICRICTLSLTFDGRHITENEAGSFLEKMKVYIENPELVGL